jgi:hypothetical protein
MENWSAQRILVENNSWVCNAGSLALDLGSETFQSTLSAKWGWPLEPNPQFRAAILACRYNVPLTGSATSLQILYDKHSCRIKIRDAISKASTTVLVVTQSRIFIAFMFPISITSAYACNISVASSASTLKITPSASICRGVIVPSLHENEGWTGLVGRHPWLKPHAWRLYITRVA